MNRPVLFIDKVSIFNNPELGDRIYNIKQFNLKDLIPVLKSPIDAIVVADAIDFECIGYLEALTTCLTIGLRKSGESHEKPHIILVLEDTSATKENLTKFKDIGLDITILYANSEEAAVNAPTLPVSNSAVNSDEVEYLKAQLEVAARQSEEIANALKEEIQKLIADQQALDSEYAALSASTKSANKDIEKVVGEYEPRLNAMEAERAEAEYKLIAFQGTNNKLNDLYSKATEELSVKNEIITNLEIKVTDLEKNLHTVNLEKSTLESEMVQLSATIDQTQALYESQVEESNLLKSKLQEKEQLLHTLEEQIKSQNTSQNAPSMQPQKEVTKGMMPVTSLGETTSSMMKQLSEAGQTTNATAPVQDIQTPTPNVAPVEVQPQVVPKLSYESMPYVAVQVSGKDMYVRDTLPVDILATHPTLYTDATPTASPIKFIKCNTSGTFYSFNPDTNCWKLY